MKINKKFQPLRFIMRAKSLLYPLQFLCSCLLFSPICGASTPNPFHDSNFIFEPIYGNGNYLQHSNFIDKKNIKIIFEVGSRDAIDAVRLGYYYQCPVYAFECNPQAVEICNHNVKNYPFVTVVPLACWHESTTLPFYPVVESHGGTYPVNIGGSSLLKTLPNGVDAHHKQGKPTMVQAIRLDNWMEENNISQIDLLCMDTQGATLHVLQGLGEKLTKIKYIITEAYLQPSFEGEALYPEIKEMLVKAGFEVAKEPSPHAVFTDVLFINKKMRELR